MRDGSTCISRDARVLQAETISSHSSTIINLHVSNYCQQYWKRKHVAEFQDAPLPVTRITTRCLP